MNFNVLRIRLLVKPSSNPNQINMLLTKPLYKSFSVLKKLISSKDWSGAISLLEDNPESAEKPELDDLMSNLYKDKRYMEAYKLLLLLPSLNHVPSEWEYTMALEASIESEKLHQALNIFYQSQIFGIPLDAMVYDKLLIICAKDCGSSNIRQILYSMIEDKSICSASTLNTLLKQGTQAKDYRLIENVLCIMRAAGYSIPKKVIAPFIKRAHSDSKEYKALNSYWKSIQKYVGDQDKDVELDKELKKGKDSYSFGVFVMPSEKEMEMNSEDTSEDESSD